MDVNKSLMTFASIVLVLFIIGILVVVTYIGFDHLESAACTTADTSYVWEGGACLNGTGGSAVTVDAVTQAESIKSDLGIAMSLLGLLIVIAIFVLVVGFVKKMQVSFGGGNNAGGGF